MTVREVFEFALSELNKVEAPSLLLEDYNYFINKAIYQYINQVYNLFETDQQRTDDLRVLKDNVILPNTQTVTQISSFGNSKICTLDLPNDYYHILSCIVEYTMQKSFKCYNQNEKVIFGAKRLTSDMYSQIVNNYYMKPLYKRPYYMVINGTGLTAIDANDNGMIDPLERIPNPSKSLILVHYGNDDNFFKISNLMVTYLKTPKLINLTQELVDDILDRSQIMEFPDYVCHEIINILVKLLLENSMDQRLLSHIPINQTIAPPAQVQQTQQGRNK